MFQNILEKKLKINFLNFSNCYAFEISDFLDDFQFSEIKNNLPDFKKKDIESVNFKSNNKADQHKNKIYMNELDQENYKKFVNNNLILNEFAQIFKNPKMNNFFLRSLYFEILKSRIYDPKNFIKFLLRKNLTVNKKSESFLHKIFYNDIYTTFEIAYMANGAQSFPHTDGMKKILSLLLYFPDDDISEEQSKNLGTSFYNSNEFNLTGKGKNKINSLEESDNFKKRNKIIGTFPFKKKNLYGFIKSHKSWHSVEPFFIHDNFVRRNININILLV